MVYRNTLKAVVLAAACLAPLAAFAGDAGSGGEAQYNNQISFGLMGLMGKNADQAGRYNGLNTTGVDLIGQFALHGRPKWNPDGTWYYDFTGDNLVVQTGTGLGGFTTDTTNNLANSGSVNLSLGKQGTWEGTLYYDAISYTGNVIDSLYSVDGGQATLHPGLTPWGGVTDGGPATALTKAHYTIPVLNATGAMLPVVTGTRRDIFGGNFNYIDGNWTFTGAVRHDHRYGSMEESFTGPWGGTAFALPIDYTTDRYDAAVAYSTPLNQASLQYTFSRFQDDNSFVNLPYPFSNTAAPFRLSAAYSTPPSNDAHYLTLLAATNMVPKTRINLNVRAGLEMQDDMFPPNTADPAAVGGVAPWTTLNSYLQGTTANSLDDVAKVLQAKVSVDSHPIANLEASAYYGFDGRWVSLNQYKVFKNSNDTNFASAAYVVPQDWQKQNAGVDLAYRILPKHDTKLTASYRFDAVNRSNAQVGSSHTSTETIGLSSAFGPQVYGRLTYQHADRSGTLTYVTPWGNLLGDGNAGCGPTNGACFTGAYYQAPMISDGVKLMADYTPNEKLSGGLFLQFKNDNFNYPPQTNLYGTTSPLLTGAGAGITQDYNLTLGPNVHYRPRNNIDLDFYYTYERIFFNNLGNGVCSTVAQAATPQCAGTAGNWQNKYTSDVHTIGASGEWKVTDKLTLGAAYTFAYGSVMFGEFNGVFIASPPGPTLSYQNVSNYPDINSIMHDLKLTASYELVPNMDLLLQGTWTYYRDNNWNDNAWAIQGAGSTTVSYLTPGYGAPFYDDATVMVGMRYRW